MIDPFAVALGLGFASFLALALWLTRTAGEIQEPLKLETSHASWIVVIVAVVAFFAQGMDAVLQRDEAVFVVTNIEVANGNLPYVAAFDNTGPLGPWFGGLGVYLGRILGFDAVASARVTYFPVALFAVITVFALSVRARLSALASLIGAAALVAVPSFSREALSGPRTKLLVVLIAGLFVLALDRRRHMLAGGLLGLATLVWQSSFVLILVPFVYALWRGLPGTRLKALGRFLVGGLVPAAIVLLVYSAAGETSTLVEGFITWNLNMASSRLPSSIVEALVDPLKDLWGAHQATWPLLVVGGLAVLPVSRNLIAGGSRIQESDSEVTNLISIAFVVMVGWTLIDYQGVVDLFPFLPFAAFGFARAADSILIRSRAWSAALLAALAIAGAVDLIRTHNTELPQQKAELAALVGDRCVSSYGQPEALAITGQSNPSRFFFAVAGLDSHLGAKAPEYVDRLLVDRPVYVGGPIEPDGPNLARSVSATLPLAGYTPVATPHFEGWATDQPGC